VAWIVELIQGYGLDQVREPDVRHLAGDIRNGYRTPKREIDLALERAEEVTNDEPHSR
jgi:hypothetical protein